MYTHRGHVILTQRSRDNYTNRGHVMYTQRPYKRRGHLIYTEVPHGAPNRNNNNMMSAVGHVIYTQRSFDTYIEVT